MYALGLPATCIRVDVGDCLVVKRKGRCCKFSVHLEFLGETSWLEAGRRLEMQTWNRCYSSHSGKLTNPRMQLPPRGMCLLTFVEFSGDGRKFIDCVDFCVASAKICRRSTFLREDDD